MAMNMDQYIKDLRGKTEDSKMPFSVSHFENALNNANDQLMTQYIATQACFPVNNIEKLHIIQSANQ